MEAREPGVYFLVIDNEARCDGLSVVEQAEDTPALLQAAKKHFNESVTTITAERVLEEFADEQLSLRIRLTEGFDPELFKAVALFELSHLDADETMVAEYAQELARFWTSTEMSDESLEHSFTAPTKRAQYSPFDAYSDFVIWMCIDKHLSETYGHRHEETDEPEDPLKEDIDGREMKIMLGDRELKGDEHPVLTHQLMRDLRKLFPVHIVFEMKFRFPESGTFEDIHPLIERIQQERSQGELPPTAEILDIVKRGEGKGYHPLGLDPETLTPEAAERAYDEIFRDIQNRINAHDVYLPAFKAWFVEVLLSSETEVDVYYRRLWHGDLTDENSDEVKPEEKEAIVRAMEAQEKAWDEKHGDGPASRSNHRIYDVFGSWGEAVRGGGG